MQPTSSEIVGAAPIDPEDAAQALEAAADREQIFAVLLRAAYSRVPFAALLSVHRDGLWGRHAIATDQFDASTVDELHILRNAVPAFEEAVLTRSHYLGPIATGAPAVDELLRRLGGTLPATALLLPVVLGTRTVALVVAHRGEEPLALDDVDDLLPLAEETGRALARMLALRARAAAEKPRAPVATPAPAAPVEITEEIDEVEAQRRVLAACREYESWSELADAIRALLRMGLEGGNPGEDEQLELMLELGTVEAERLGRPELGVEAWRSAQTIDAGDARISEKLERLFVAHERWEDLVQLLEQRAALAEDVQERVWILQNVAALSRDRLLDDARAIEAYERIRSWAPDHAATTQKLEELYRAHGHWQPLAALWLDVASRAEDPVARVTALESAAQIYQERLDDPRAAFLVWLTVLRREPMRPGGLEALEQLAAAAEAWDELAPECEMLAGELETVDPTAAARLWRLVGHWKRDQLKRPEEAVDALERALSQTPDDVELLDELLDLRRAAGASNERSSALARRAALEVDPSRRCALFCELGDSHATRDAQDEAVTAYESALAADPTSEAALLGLRRAHLAQQAWQPLAALLPRLIDVVDRAQKPALLLELGGILDERLGRADEATRVLEDALAIEPGHALALQKLAQLHRAAGRNEAYLATLEAELDATAPADAPRRAELAGAWEEIGKPDRAAACWRKVLAIDGGDETAHEGLAKSLRKAGRWAELTDAQRAHLAVAAPAERVRILVELAGDLETHRDDVDGALAACQEALALASEHDGALELLARCYTRQGRWLEAIGTLQRLAARAGDATSKAELQQRIARIHASRDDEPNARAMFESALQLDRNNAAAHEGLARLCERRSDWRQAADHLRSAGQTQPNRFDAIRCLTEAAAIYSERLGDLPQAGECLRRIVDLDPEHVDAKEGVTEILAATGQWAALWPYVAELAETMHSRSDAAPVEKRTAYVQAARCALELGKSDKARELMERAVAVDPGHVPVLVERADVLRRIGSLEAAVKAYQAILVQHAAVLEPSARAALFRKLALVHQQLGNAPQTLAYYRKVLEFAPHDRETLRDLAELHLARAQFDEAVGAWRSLVEAVPPEEKAALLERMADVLHGKLKNHGRAASTYLDALALDGTNRRILQKLLDLQSETGQWKAALETIERFIALESDLRRRGKYIQAMAAIRRFKLKEEAAALDDYERALAAFLDGSPPLDEGTRASALEAFQNIDELVTARQDWARQDRAYRFLIKHLPPGDPLLVGLWHSLGEIQRTRLQQVESAIIAFETAHSLDPQKSPERVRILAELYARVGKRAPATATSHAARLVDAEPDNPDAYRAMGHACLEAGRIDEAWCVSRALVYRNQARPEEQEFYQRYREHERRKANGVLDDETWAQLRDEGEDPIVSAIFALVWQGPVALRAGPPKSFGLKSKDKLKVEDASRPIGKIFQNAARALNAPLPHVYAQPERSGRLLVASCVENGALAPTVIVARDLMTGYRDTEIAFCVASTLAMLRPAWYLRLALPTVAELQAVLIAAMSLVRKKVAVDPELAPFVDACAAEIRKRMTSAGLQLLSGLVGRLGERPDLARWRNAVDAAARRAALLVCGELDAAARMVSTEPMRPDGPRPKDKIRDLVVFSVSPAYFAARRKLGVTVA